MFVGMTKYPPFRESKFIPCFHLSCLSSSIAQHPLGKNSINCKSKNLKLSEGQFQKFNYELNTYTSITSNLPEALDATYRRPSLASVWPRACCKSSRSFVNQLVQCHCASPFSDTLSNLAGTAPPMDPVAPNQGNYAKCGAGRIYSMLK